MIVGLGSDIVDIRRIEKMLSRFGEKFEKRVFSVGEQSRARRRGNAGRNNNMASTYAKRFAAKEAFSKAVGTGFSRGVFMRDIEVVNLPSGQPTLKLTGNAQKAMLRLIPPQKTPSIQITLTDEYPTAQALVIISAI